MSGKEYRVGQILYVIPSKKPMVIPVCVLEKRISETLKGVATTYVVKSPKPDADPVDLATVQGTVFESIELVKETMLQNSLNAIEEMIDKAINVSEKAFGKNVLHEPAQDNKELPPKEEDPLGIDSEQDDPRLPEEVGEQ